MAEVIQIAAINENDEIKLIKLQIKEINEKHKKLNLGVNCNIFWLMVLFIIVCVVIIIIDKHISNSNEIFMLIVKYVKVSGKTISNLLKLHS